MFSMFDFMFNIIFILFFAVFIIVAVTIAITALRGVRHFRSGTPRSAAPAKPRPTEPEQKRELRCPYCGAPIHRDDERCAYCDAKL